MLNLKDVIQQLEEEDFEKISDKLEASKADKYHLAFRLYRENQSSEATISEELEVSSNAFYVLKSRLYDKIQEHLLENLVAPKTDILRKIVTIPNLVFNTKREIAMSILSKLEKDLTDYDMPNELTAVYNAMKKIHLGSEKYYKYSQLYNTHIAYTLSIGKAEDILAEFVSKLGQYYASRDPSLLEFVSLLKDEMTNVSRLYRSHHLNVYKDIIDASIAIFMPLEKKVKDDDPVEDILGRMEDTLSAYPKDTTYQYLRNVVNFLFFEYYHKLNLPKKESQYFDLVGDHLPSFLLYNHSCFCSKFLISRIERYVYLEIEDQLYEENNQLFKEYQPDINDIPNHINYVKYLSASAFHAGKYDESAKLLMQLLNDISFKDFTHSEIEVKLFLSLAYSFCNKYDLAWNVLRNTQRKIRELNKVLSGNQPDETYENAAIFARMLKIPITSKSSQITENLTQVKNQFEFYNRGSYRMLEFLKMDEEFIKALARRVK